MAAAEDKLVLTVEFGPSTGSTTNPFYTVMPYVNEDAGGSADDLIDVFLTDVAPQIQAVMTNKYKINRFSAINLDNFEDFAENETDLIGGVNADTLPMWDTWKFKYVRPTRAINNGSRAIPAVPESYWRDLGLEGDGATAVAALASALEAILVESSHSYTPAIWRRAGTYDVAGVPTVFPHTFYRVSQVVFAGVGHQLTRQR